MATTYTVCPDEIRKLAERIQRRDHHDQIEAAVSITYLFARNPEGPPLSFGGYPAAAIFKINSLKDRVAGLTDATISIDEDAWESYSEETRLALLDHELLHGEVCRNKVGAFKYDDANRPKLRIRKHDFQIGGFHMIAKRHGTDAIEVQNIQHVNMAWKQMELDFAKVT